VGTPHGCEAHTGLECQPAGCSWRSEECSGTPEPCGSLDEASCPNHAGCSWSPSGGCTAPSTCADRDLASCTDGCLLSLCAP
jgi:hypothetical protein